MDVKAKERDYYYDNLRIFLMFVVVVCHGLENIRSTSATIAAGHEILLSFVMPLFVFLTGFFAKGIEIGDSIKRDKIFNLIVLYIVVQLIKMAISESTSILMPSYGNWFIVVMIVWYSILPGINKFRPRVVMIVSVLASLLIGMDSKADSVFHVSRIVCFFPFFMAGFYLSKEQAEVLKKVPVRMVGLCLFAGGVIFCLEVWQAKTPFALLHARKTYSQMNLSVYEGFIMRLGWYVLTSTMSFGVMSFIPRKKFKLTVLGTRTLPIFIMHTCIYVYLMNKTNFFVMIGELPNGYIKLGIILIFSVLVTLICGNKNFSKFFDWFMGLDFKCMKK